ncbi:MAG: hypothetical protein R2817_07050 [Flavobacteriales bacterium]
MAWHLPARLLSLLYPITIERSEGRFGPLEVRWEHGRKVLNSANANQSFGALHRVLQAALPDAVSGISDLRTVLLLGLGGGSAVHILRNELKRDPRITAIELDPVMIDVAGRHFAVLGDARLTVIQGDATVQVHVLRDRFDLVVVDLFADDGPAEGTGTQGFIHALRDRVADGGRLVYNTMAHDGPTAARSERVHALLRRTFLRVTTIHSEGLNRVFVAH